jgi:DNA-binding transcriptional MerR regulator
VNDNAIRHAIGELARVTGSTPRTIRYYVAQGLLPAPDGQGPGAHYGQRHLERLQLIKRLQRQHLPLAEIRTRLEGLTDEQVTDLTLVEPPALPTDSALDYIRGVLGQPPQPPQALAGPPARTTRLMALAVRADGAGSAAGAPSAAGADESNLERSQWERLSLGPNFELHVRRPLSRLEQRRVERLITIARQVLKEETP